ncbi:MAG: AAA family ATPase, partial [Armatimonadetes bacterium]|nr:AAA family ATPase [Armatimonadota bacterium]
LTQTTREEHHQRYAGVIHLVTAADGAPEHYRRWPEAHRPETPDEAVQLDLLLRQAWSGHPNHFVVDNNGRDWARKSEDARQLLHRLVFG